MTRVAFLASLLSFDWIRRASASEHEHLWVQGPFWITAARTFEEPRFYPPGVLVNVEHCTGCGILRLPGDLKKLNQSNINAGVK